MSRIMVTELFDLLVMTDNIQIQMFNVIKQIGW